MKYGLIDAETNEEFKIIVNSRDANRARTDLKYATQLLQHAKLSTQIGYTSSQGTSTSSNVQETDSNTSSNLEELGSSQEEAISFEEQEAAISFECAEVLTTHAWTKQETLLLLQLYREHHKKFVSGKGSIKKNWNNIAKFMQEKGHNINGYKCSTKFQSLKRTYKCITDHNKKSGNNRRDWEYLQIMQELFGDKLWVQPLAVAGSHEKENIFNFEEEFAHKAITRTKTNKQINDYIIFSKEDRTKRRETRTKQHEEKLNAFKRIENLLQLIEKEKKTEN
ncbi:uncharacterized protein LOC116847547 [Odontomachus brunneus]|uniref:uncharacterized protein LOC116847547 n=1 Tax=Odontomachus brunneus TaxID=486640 RepID=UPI0013F25D93|nr:uncharacterized protein LOC116847547 [Odontomachus brunneus]